MNKPGGPHDDGGGGAGAGGQEAAEDRPELVGAGHDLGRAVSDSELAASLQRAWSELAARLQRGCSEVARL